MIVISVLLCMEPTSLRIFGALILFNDICQDVTSDVLCLFFSLWLFSKPVSLATSAMYCWIRRTFCGRLRLLEFNSLHRHFSLPWPAFIVTQRFIHSLHCAPCVQCLYWLFYCSTTQVLRKLMQQWPEVMDWSSKAWDWKWRNPPVMWDVNPGKEMIKTWVTALVSSLK